MNKKAKICLNAMVGNEAPTIKRMLESVVPYIDYWVIQCNGNDDTKTIINQFFEEKGIPGFTYDTEWLFPGYNRNHTLQVCLKAEHGCDWILRMDADERLHVDEDFDWSVMDDTSIQSFNIVAQNGGLKYFRTWFWNAKLPWFFAEDKRHETIHLPEISEDFQRVNMPLGFRHLVSQDGETWNVPRKFLKDALELEIDKVVGNKVLEDTYHLWYIAKSYADCYGKPSELPFGKKHSDEYARRSIWYFERYLEVRHGWSLDSDETPDWDEMAYFGLIIMGQCYSFMENNEMAELCFDKAYNFCDVRNEHIIYKIFHLQKNHDYERILKLLDFMARPERVNPFPRCTFLIEDRCYYNTSNFIFEMKESVNKKLNVTLIDNESVNFFE